MWDAIDIAIKGIALGLLFVIMWNIGRIATGLDRVADSGISIVVEKSDVRKPND